MESAEDLAVNSSNVCFTNLDKRSKAKYSIAFDKSRINEVMADMYTSLVYIHFWVDYNIISRIK